VSAMPNPFKNSTVFWYRLPSASQATLKIFDAAGHRVASLDLGTQSAGVHAQPWDGAGDGGARLIPGVYFLRLEAGGQSWTKSLVRIR
jgi:flagellar hook assembly protein FlgD